MDKIRVRRKDEDGLKFLALLPDCSVDGIFTDPPWGSGPEIVGQDHWKELLEILDEQAIRVLKPDAKALVWMGLRQMADALRCFTKLEYRWSIFCQYIPGRWIAGFESRFDPILLFQSDTCEIDPEMYGYGLDRMA
jgi:hypothetical protein